MLRSEERCCGDALQRIRNRADLRADRLGTSGLPGRPRFGTPFGSAFGAPFFGRLLRGRLKIVQLFIRGLLATLPEGVDFVTELLPSLDLTANDNRLLIGEKARLSAAFHRVGKAKVWAVTGLGVMRAGASRFAAFNEALGDGTTPRGDGIVPREGGDRVGVGHKSILRQTLP